MRRSASGSTIRRSLRTAPIATQDGQLVLISIQNEREWVRFCAEVLGDGSIAVDPRFNSNVGRVSNRAAAR